MRSPLRSSLLLLVVAISVFAADEKTPGRLTTGCVDRTVSPEFCGWVVRYRTDDSANPVRTAKTAEQQAVESSLMNYSAVQPAQIQGTRASVLVQRPSGDFAVISLTKRDGAWAIVTVAEPVQARR
jgi:hypothetical protein